MLTSIFGPTEMLLAASILTAQPTTRAAEADFQTTLTSTGLQTAQRAGKLPWHRTVRCDEPRVICQTGHTATRACAAPKCQSAAQFPRYSKQDEVSAVWHRCV